MAIPLFTHEKTTYIYPNFFPLYMCMFFSLIQYEAHKWLRAEAT